jgi:hypothetical protein
MYDITRIATCIGQIAVYMNGVMNMDKYMIVVVYDIRETSR